MPTFGTRAPDIPGMVEYQRDLIRRADYETLGRVKCIVIDPEAQGNMPTGAVTEFHGRRLDFYGQWPLIAQSRDHSTLLLVGHKWGPAFLLPGGKVGLPDIPDPTWKRPAPSDAEFQSPTFRPPEAPLIPQKLSERARGVVPATNTRYFVCGPIAQILVKPDDLPIGLLIHAFGGGPDGRRMEVFIDQTTGEGFLLFGRYEIRRAG